MLEIRAAVVELALGVGDPLRAVREPDLLGRRRLDLLELTLAVLELFRSGLKLGLALGEPGALRDHVGGRTGRRRSGRRLSRRALGREQRTEHLSLVGGDLDAKDERL